MKHIVEKIPSSKILLFISIGPSLIGWAYGICKYNANSNEFKLSIQNFIIFITYIVILLINHFFSTIGLYHILIMLSIDSFLAAFYLLFSLIVAYKYISNEKVILFKKIKLSFTFNS